MTACFSIPDCGSFHQVLGPTSEYSFTIIHVNIRSLRKHWEQFRVLVSDFNPPIDVFVLTEISISSSQGNQFVLNGYNELFHTRERSRGGGIAIYVKEKWLSTSLNVSFSHAESLAISISQSGFSLYLLTIYRPPSENVSLFLAELEVALKESRSEGQFCMVGDLNIDTLKPYKSNVCDYLTLLSEYGIESTISLPTREELLSGKLVASCIDHINTRSPDTTVKSAVITNKLSDHYFIGCRLQREVNERKEKARGCTFVSITDTVKFDLSVATFDWNQILMSVEPAAIYSVFVEVFQSFYRNSLKEVKFKKRSDKPWLNTDIMVAIKTKEALWLRSRRAPKNLELSAEFKCARNRVNAIIRSAKRRYFQRKFFETRSNPRETWELINTFRGRASRQPINISLERHFGANLQSTVDDFNKIFASTSGIARDRKDTSTSSEHKLRSPSSAFLPPLDLSILRSILFGIKRNKAPGIDGIRVGDLCRNFDAIKEVLLVMINGFLSSGIIPVDLKTALVKPLFKGGTPKKHESYRPISILPCIGEILEKHLFTVMSSFIDSSDMLSNNQYGFVAGKGTQLLLEDFADLIHTAFENNLFACALFLDLSKAFDAVSHDVLLSKLHNFGFRGPFFLLLQNFFSERSQIVSVGQFRSTRVMIKAGVPQGSVLSPLLFNIYVNDISTRVSKCRLFQYADDTLLVSRHLNYYHAVNLLKHDATQIMDWFDENLITINASKTKLVCFRNPLKKVNLDSPVTLHKSNCTDCLCSQLDYVDKVKYLGVYFDSDMSWNSHMSYLCKRIRSVSCLLFNNKVFMPFAVRKSIAHALGYSIVRYGITIFGNCAELWKIKIDRILRAMLKSVGYNSDFPTDINVFEALQMPNFSALFVQSVVLRHFWSNDFKLPFVSHKSLRHTSRFVTPRCVTRYGKRVRSYYVPFIFNTLPEHVIEASTKKQLKKLMNSLSV